MICRPSRRLRGGEQKRLSDWLATIRRLDRPAVAPRAAHAGDERAHRTPVPRITIHASCDRHAISDIIAGISADRRMARAEITVDSGGIDAAISRFAAQASPNLLIIDTLQQGAAMLHSLDRLAQVIEEGTKVVIIGAVNDIALFLELMALGVTNISCRRCSRRSDPHRCGALRQSGQPFAGRVVAVIAPRRHRRLHHRAQQRLSIADVRIQHNPARSRSLLRTAALDSTRTPPQSIADALMAPDRVDDVFLRRVTTKQTQRLQMRRAATLEREFETRSAILLMVI